MPPHQFPTAIQRGNKVVQHPWDKYQQSANSQEHLTAGDDLIEAEVNYAEHVQDWE